MIRIDMKMPKSCKECPLTYLDCGDDAYFGRNERRCVVDDSCIDGTNERAYDCPLKEVNTDSVLEDIKAEISKLYVDIVNDDLELGNNRAVYKAIKIIDSYISGEK